MNKNIIDEPDFSDPNSDILAQIQIAIDSANSDGPFIDHKKIDNWLNSWGTDQETPPPSCD